MASSVNKGKSLCSLFLLFFLCMVPSYSQNSEEHTLSLAAQLAADSDWLRINQPAKLELSSFLAIESMHRGMLLEGSNALRHSLDLLQKPRVYQQYRGPLNAIAFSNDGHWLASGGKDGKAHLLDLKTLVGREWSQSDTSSITCVAFSSDSRYLAVGSSLGHVYIYAANNEHREAAMIWVGSKIIAVSFGGNSTKLAIASADGATEIRDLDLEMRSHHLGALHHSQPIAAAAFGPDAKIIVIADKQGMAHIINIDDDRESPGMTGQSDVRIVAVSKDAQWIAIADVNSTIRIFEAKSGREVAHIFQESDAEIKAITFDKSGRWLAIGRSDPAVRVYAWREAREVARLILPERVTNLAFGPENNQIAVAGISGILGLFRINDSREMFHKSAEFPVSMAVSPNEEFLAVGTAKSEAYLFEMKNGKEIIDHEHTGWVTAVGFSSKSDFLAIGDEKSARVLSLPIGIKSAFFPSDVAVRALTFGHNGQWLGINGSASGTVTARIIDLMSSKEAPPIPTEGAIGAMAFSNKSKLFATAGDKTVRVFHAETTLELPADRHKFDGIVLAVAFSPDDRLLAVGTDDHKIHLVDLLRHREIWWASESSPVVHIAFNSVANVFATVTTAGILHIYDINSGKLAAQIETNDKDIKSLSFSEDGRYIIAGNVEVDSIFVKRYIVNNEDLIRDACSLLSRKGLSDEDWNGHFYGETYRSTCP